MLCCSNVVVPEEGTTLLQKGLCEVRPDVLRGADAAVVIVENRRALVKKLVRRNHRGSLLIFADRIRRVHEVVRLWGLRESVLLIAEGREH